MCKSLLDLKVSGASFVPREGGFILATNHASNLDPLVIGAACPRELHFMAKQELFRNPVFSWVLHHVNAFPLKRRGMDISAVKEAIRRVRNGKALLIFPEGTRSPDGSLGAAQEGVGFLASKLDVPVIPACIEGTQYALGKGSRHLRRHPVRVRFGKQILLERRLAYQDLAVSIMQAIKNLSCTGSG